MVVAACSTIKSRKRSNHYLKTEVWGIHFFVQGTTESFIVQLRTTPLWSHDQNMSSTAPEVSFYHLVQDVPL